VDEQIWFRRRWGQEELLVAVNQHDRPVELPRTEAIRRWVGEATLEDLLNDEEGVNPIAPRQPVVLFPRWARVFRRVSG